MKSGRMDRLITIQTRTVALDSYGQPIETWGAAGNTWSAWAEVKDVSGDERFASQQIVGRETKTFRIYFRTEFTPAVDTHRIVHDGRNWDIHNVTEIARREGWEILASARSEA